MKISANTARALLLLSPSLVLSNFIVPVANAQDLVLEEIIVTARKREESLQETPLAVSAYNGRTLREAGIDTMDDLNAIVPGIDLQSGSGISGRANIFIRGVGQRNTGPNIDSGVGIYLDGVYLSRADGALLDMNDIGSVQVLRGPQGTLFGKNTTGGAVAFETNRPSDEFDMSIMMRAGDHFRRDGSVMVNLPLVEDVLSTRLSLSAIKRDGFMRNVTTGKLHNDEDRISGVWQLRWTPNDDVTIDLNTNYSKTNQTARAQKCLPVDGIEGWQGPGFDALLVNSIFGTDLQGLCDVSANLGEYEWTGDIDRSARYFAETKGVSLTADWAINDNLSLKSITGWRETQGASENDLDPTAAHITFISGLEHPEAVPDKTHQFTQEFQFNGQAFDGKLNYVTGAFFFTEETDERIQVSEVAAVEIAALAGRIVTLTSTRTELLADNESWAVYSQMDWNFNDNWRATIGARYTSEDRNLFRRRAALDPDTLSTAPGPVINLGGAFLLPAENSFNTAWGFNDALAEETRGSVSATEFTPMASIQYLFDGDGFINGGSAYLTFSQGFLSGGLSEAPRASPDADGDGFTDDTDGDGIPNGAPFDEFLPEEVTNYELGIKLDAWDNRLRMNAALFYSDYDNRQLTTIVINPVTNSPAGATFNAKSSSITGLELETTLLPFGNLELTMNASFYDGKIKEYEDTRLSLVDVPAGQDCVADGIGVAVGPACVLSEVIDRSDEDLARLPERTLYLGAQYRFEGDYGTIIPRIQFSKKYNVERCFERGSCESGLWNVDETNLSARISWLTAGDRVNLAVYGTNLTNERDIIGGQPLVDSYGFGGVTFSPPRMYGAEIQFNF